MDKQHYLNGYSIILLLAQHWRKISTGINTNQNSLSLRTMLSHLLTQTNLTTKTIGKYVKNTVFFLVKI
jgi:hypothetical protein